MQPAHDRQVAGIALVLVLWLLALLSIIAGSLVFSSRADLLIAGNLAELARAEAFADAGVHRAIAEIAGSTPNADPRRWKADGLARQWRYHDALLVVAIRDEAAKIDLNTASPPLLVGLFRSVGAPDPEALTDALLDWRDSDDLRSPKGAEKDDYLAAGRKFGPANAALESIDELRQVLGVTEDLYRAVEPSITVHSYQAGINPAVAPRQVLLALPGVTPEQVDLYLDQRRNQLEQGLPAPPFPPAQGFITDTVATAIGIQVEAVLRDNTRFLREAVVRLNGPAQEPPSILAWRAPPVTAIVGPDSHGQSR